MAKMSERFRRTTGWFTARKIIVLREFRSLLYMLREALYVFVSADDGPTVFPVQATGIDRSF
jgi:hypothetical protein